MPELMSHIHSWISKNFHLPITKPIGITIICMVTFNGIKTQHYFLTDPFTLQVIQFSKQSLSMYMEGISVELCFM